MTNHRFPTLVMAALLAIGWIAPARGQDDTDSNARKPDRDPFALPDRARGEGRRNGAAVVPAALPDLALQGFIETADGARIALLKIDSRRTYLVREGDTLTVSRAQGEWELRIAGVDRMALRIEVGQTGRVVVIR